MTAPSPAWLRAAPAFVRRRVEGRTNLLAVIHNTGWLFADKAMRMVMGVLVGAWVARYLGPSQRSEERRCRERVSISVVAVSVKKKRTGEQAGRRGVSRGSGTGAASRGAGERQR